MGSHLRADYLKFLDEETFFSLQVNTTSSIEIRYQHPSQSKEWRVLQFLRKVNIADIS